MSRVATLCFALLAFSVFAFVSLPAYAQTDDSSAAGGADPFTIDVTPQYPTPYSSITITPSSTIFDITNADITVKVNGATFYKGSGSTGIVVPLGGPGSTTKIVISALAEGQTYTKTLTISPADVALVVEPVSTTHPFYAGEGLVPSEGRVRLIAIPDFRTSSGRAIDPTSLVYDWSLGDQALDSDSGIGKSVLDATAPQQYRDADVSVTVQSQDGSLIAQANTTISPVSPITRIYEEDPLLGPLYDTALSGSYTMSDAEDTFLGVPYYFSGSPTLDWTVNGNDSGSDPDITVRSTGDGSGSAVLNFSANDPTTVESANSTISVLFGNSNSTGLFGL